MLLVCMYGVGMLVLAHIDMDGSQELISGCLPQLFLLCILPFETEYLSDLET